MNRNALKLTIQYIAIFTWLSLLAKTDSYYSIYLLIGITAIAIVTYHFIIKKRQTNKHKKMTLLFSSFLSLATTLANFPIFYRIAENPDIAHSILAIITAIIVFICGTITFSIILFAAQGIVIKTVQNKSKSPRKVFFTSFLIFAIIDILVLFSCCYPGNLSIDSIDEVGQTISGIYSNHHPFYYTILIHPFISIGTNLFHDINIGIALFNTFQIAILSSAFAYSISTLYRIGISQKILFVLTIILAILPYNIFFSFTVWKDVLFGAAFLIFTVTLYRRLHSIQFTTKSSIPQTALLFFSGLAVCLFRTNALLAIIISTIAFFVIFKKNFFKLGIIISLIVVTAFILKYPILNALSVTQTDLVESLSIPSQQIARTLKFSSDQISDEDIALINELASPKDLADAYNPIISDPVKNTIRKYNNQDYLKAHVADYALMYMKLGLQHPMHYLTAWIDQTKGYWNGGYYYWIWTNEIQDNEYDITRKHNPVLNKAFHYYGEMYRKIPLLQPLISIGFTVWAIIALLYRIIIDKNKKLVFLLIPLLATWATLLIATPVFAEFRYAYFIFTTAPFLFFVTLAETKLKRNQHEKR